MHNFTPAPCIPEDGIEARIPNIPYSVLTLIEVRNRLNASPESLQESLHLSLAQVYAALAYYHANQSLFDAELARRQDQNEQNLTVLAAQRKGHNGFAGIYGQWPGNETDEEINTFLEHLS